MGTKRARSGALQSLKQIVPEVNNSDYSDDGHSMVKPEVQSPAVNPMVAKHENELLLPELSANVISSNPGANNDDETLPDSVDNPIVEELTQTNIASDNSDDLPSKDDDLHKPITGDASVFLNLHKLASSLNLVTDQALDSKKGRATKDHDYNNNASQNLDVLPTMLAASSQDKKSVAVSAKPSPTKTTLNYSQQQAEILQHSPSRRREVIPRLTPKNEPRLVITKLVLTNFKSYAGVQEIGPFNASFSAVVGPNGSGKSNVIDSLLFVFGFRALKMRQAKLSELIHNSSEGEKLTFCQVDIHFNHIIDDPHIDGAYSVVPKSSLIVSRKATRQNQSTYFLDGNNSNYTEVTTYLKGKGIDLEHKRFLILQGEVESIAQMKAKAERDGEDGLLEYLEDIIGTSNYKPLIEENQIRVETLNEACLEKENRFHLVESDKNSLEDKKDAALRFLAHQKQLVGTKSIQFQTSISRDLKTLRLNEQEIASLQTELSVKKEENMEYTGKITKEIAEQDAVKKEIERAAKKLFRAAEKQREAQRVGVSLEEKAKNYLNKLKKAEKTRASLQTTSAQAKAKLENTEQEMMKATSDLEELNTTRNIEREKLDEVRASLTSKTSHLTEQIELLQKQLDPWNLIVKEKDNAISLVSSTIELLRAEKSSKEKQLVKARQRLVDIKKDGKQKELEFSEETDKLGKIIEQINLGEEQCSSERQSLSEMRARVQNARLKTQDAVSSLSLNENRNQVLTSLMRLAKSGRIVGFHGRLGDLGVIDDIYDAAISTACPGLDSMVVDTVETAQICIDYLRKNRLGYANFICLDKLRQFNLSPITTPGDSSRVKRLFDLIKPQNPKFGPAFYSKLFDTLVAPDLREAKNVAYGAKRWKVVTLDGKVVDTSGTMSGGGSYVARGGMRLTNSHRGGGAEYTQEDVVAMQEDLLELEAAYDEAESNLRQKEEMLQKLKAIRPETEFAISRLRLDIESLSVEKKEITVVCKALIAESEDSEAQDKYTEPISENEARLEALTSERAETKLQMADLESQIQSLQDSIMAMGGVELKMQNSKLDSIKQQIEIINERTSNGRMAMLKLGKDIERHDKIAVKTEEEISNLKEALEATKSMQAQEVAALEAIEKEVNEIESTKAEKEEELEALSTNLGEHQEVVARFKSLEIELEHEIEKCQSHLRKAEFKINDAKSQLLGLNTINVAPYIYWLPEDEQAQYDGAVLREYTGDELEEMDLDVVNSEVEAVERYMATVQVDIEVLKEYGSKKDEFEARRAELNTAVEERDSVRKHCEELRKNRLDEFMQGFNDISMTLKDMYRMITMGGNAELELVDSLDPFSEGILFSVMPPKKSWKNISNLSGGEKTLSSLALVFALHQYKPTPLYVMDEIDAALDFRNVSIVANYIRERTKNAQFIVISLRNNMFELAQQLVGIYKVSDKTKSVSLNNRDFLTDE